MLIVVDSLKNHHGAVKLGLYLWTVGCALASAAALLLASWGIIRERQVALTHENLERLVVLENQSFRNDLLAIQDEISKAGQVASSIDQAAGVNALLRAIIEIRSRLDELDDRTENIRRIKDHYGPKDKEVLDLRSAIDKLSHSQTDMEHQLSDENRFYAYRAGVVDALLKGLEDRIDALSSGFSGLMRDSQELSASIVALEASLTSNANQSNVDPEVEKKSQINDDDGGLPSVIWESIDPQATGNTMAEPNDRDKARNFRAIGLRRIA